MTKMAGSAASMAAILEKDLLAAKIDEITKEVLKEMKEAQGRRDGTGTGAGGGGSSALPAPVVTERQAIAGDIPGVLKIVLAKYKDYVETDAVMKYARACADAEHGGREDGRGRKRGRTAAFDRTSESGSSSTPTEGDYGEMLSDAKLWTKDRKWMNVQLRGDVVGRVAEGIRTDVLLKTTDLATRKEQEVALEALRQLMCECIDQEITIDEAKEKCLWGKAMIRIYDRFRLLNSAEGTSGAARGAALAVGAARLAGTAEVTDQRYIDMNTTVRETVLMVAGGAPRAHAAAVAALPGTAGMALARAAAGAAEGGAVGGGGGGAGRSGGGGGGGGGGGNYSFRGSGGAQQCFNCRKFGHTQANCWQPGGGAHGRGGGGRGRGGRGNH